MKKTPWVDCETTGLDPVKHGIVQIAMLMDINGYVEDRLVVKCQPFDDDKFDHTTYKNVSIRWGLLKHTLNVVEDFYNTPTGISPKEILTYPKPDEVFPQFTLSGPRLSPRFPHTQHDFTLVDPVS